jgi:hypothetical protein
MRRRLALSVAAMATLTSVVGAADDEERATCVYRGTTNPCAPYACVPVDLETDPDLLPPKPLAYCGKCTPGRDEECAGAKCNPDGTCSAWPAASPPPKVWPHFQLVVGDASLAIEPNKDAEPIVGVGYLFQGAFDSVAPVKEVGGPYIAPNLPWLYWDVGVSAAFGGAGQNVFGSAGLTVYDPKLPLSMTTLGVGAVYQRVGTAIWRIPGSFQNEDRLGPDLTIGFLQNVFLRAAWLLPLGGNDDERALLFSVIYMRDLAGDLVPDMFHKYLPDALK